MRKSMIKHFIQISLFLLVIFTWSCKVAKLPLAESKLKIPISYNGTNDTVKQQLLPWRNYFSDPNLVALIDSALHNNREIEIMSREMQISQNEVMARSGEYRPFVRLGFGAGLEHSGKYTWNGVSEEDLRSAHKDFPTYVGDQMLQGQFSWEIDVWKKLHNAQASAQLRFLSSIEGRSYAITQLVAEIAHTYYELEILDNQVEMIQQNISLQSDALQMVEVQKTAAKLNQLAVNRFEAQLINTKNLLFDLQQSIVEAENRLYFLTGQFPSQGIKRSKLALTESHILPQANGVPSELLSLRPDIRQATYELEASKLDIKVAKANFYPNITLRAGMGLQSFNPIYLVSPKSLAFNFLGDLMAPIVNKKAITANYNNSSERQKQAVLNYDQTIINAYVDVVNQLSASEKYTKSYLTKAQQVDILNKSIGISIDLFRSARADYTEVLLTQREALEAKMQLIEIKQKQISSEINLYRALGGGWQ